MLVLGVDYTREELLQRVPTARAVPQVFWNDQHIGSLPELPAFIKTLT